MAKKGTTNGSMAKAGSARGKANRATPRSLTVYAEGFAAGPDFARMMFDLMGDVLSERVTPVQANAVCNAAGKLLKLVDLQLRHGNQRQQEGALDMLAAPAAVAKA